MSMEKRIENLEKRYGVGRDCNLILLVPHHDGDKETSGPMDEQVDQYLKESGLCQDCSGTCMLYWDGKGLRG
jgi:hypothetical protein